MKLKIKIGRQIYKNFCLFVIRSPWKFDSNLFRDMMKRKIHFFCLYTLPHPYYIEKNYIPQISSFIRSVQKKRKTLRFVYHNKKQRSYAYVWTILHLDPDVFQESNKEISCLKFQTCRTTKTVWRPPTSQQCLSLPSRSFCWRWIAVQLQKFITWTSPLSAYVRIIGFIRIRLQKGLREEANPQRVGGMDLN